jgi:hypothetical protein
MAERCREWFTGAESEEIEVKCKQWRKMGISQRRPGQASARPIEPGSKSKQVASTKQVYHSFLLATCLNCLSTWRVEQALSSETSVNSTGLYGIISQKVVTAVRSTSNKLASFLSPELHFSFLLPYMWSFPNRSPRHIFCVFLVSVIRNLRQIHWKLTNFAAQIILGGVQKSHKISNNIISSIQLF